MYREHAGQMSNCYLIGMKRGKPLHTRTNGTDPACDTGFAFRLLSNVGEDIYDPK